LLQLIGEVLYVAVVCGCAPVKGARGYAFPPVVEKPRIVIDCPLRRVKLYSHLQNRNESLFIVGLINILIFGTVVIQFFDRTYSKE